MNKIPCEKIIEKGLNEFINLTVFYMGFLGYSIYKIQKSREGKKKFKNKIRSLEDEA